MSLVSFREGRGFPSGDLEAVVDCPIPIEGVAKRLNVNEIVAAKILERCGVLPPKSGASRKRERRPLDAFSYLAFERKLASLVQSLPAAQPSDPAISVGKAVRNKLRRFDVTISSILGLRSEEHTSELQSLMRISY